MGKGYCYECMAKKRIEKTMVTFTGKYFPKEHKMVHDLEWPILEKIEAEERGRQEAMRAASIDEPQRERVHPWSPEYFADQEEEEERVHPWSPEWYADQEEGVLVLIFV